MTMLALPDTLVGWLARCERGHPKAIDMTLDRVRRVRDRLGIAFRAPVVMVAGTNGKGSTCALIDSIARQEGLRVGLYTKPHLVHFEERCRINGTMVQAESLLPHFRAVEAARGDTTLTYFEHTTLAILSLLSAADLDLVVLEVGLGGRCDAVNVVDPDCAVITGIGIDHTDQLGPDREAIGREKAGIMRAGRPVVIGDPSPPMSLLGHAQGLGAPLHLAGRDFRVSRHNTGLWTWEGWAGRREGLPEPAAHGGFQLQNAATALAALACLPLPAPSNAAVAEGLRQLRLPGRFHVLAGEPEVILDVAHNPQAVGVLAATLLARPVPGRTVAVFGCMLDKDIASMVDAIAPLIDLWCVTDLSVPRAATAKHLWHLLHERGHACTTHFEVTSALQAAAHACSPGDRIVVFGSFHTVGPVLSPVHEDRHGNRDLELAGSTPTAG